MTFLLIEISVSDSDRNSGRFADTVWVLTAVVQYSSVISFSFFLQQNRLNFLVLTAVSALLPGTLDESAQRGMSRDCICFKFYSRDL